MSFQYKRPDVCVVVCEICGDFSWVGDPQWRKMPHGTEEQPIHLCRACRPVAVWCAEHRQYHLPEALHRCACADCGGLFTSVVANAITRCPSCRRAAGDYPAALPQPKSKPTSSFIHKLFSLHIGHRHT